MNVVMNVNAVHEREVNVKHWWRLNPRPSMEGPRIQRGPGATVGGSVVGAVPGEL